MDYDHYTKSQLIEMLVELKWDFEHLQTMLSQPSVSCRSKLTGWTNHYTLFPSFVNDDNKCLLLIDSSYRICFINEAAARLLGLKNDRNLSGQSISSLFDHDQALEVKHMIDKAYFSGNKESQTDISCSAVCGKPIHLDITALRVKFRDQIAIRLSLSAE